MIDFDSTFTKVEALDELCEISKASASDKQECLQKIKDITEQAMEGSLSFREALEKRVALLGANRSHLNTLVSQLKEKVSESIKRNKEFFQQNSADIIIMSSGFKEFIEPLEIIKYHDSQVYFKKSKTWRTIKPL